ncbi:hypothetical protein [Alkalihalobacterium sp. APHAB7]|uniref:hypothetical protein n=1 Tax=Alkalihalobacterium sp. APHAB7 TaxID=3402081 RepID=UPI003AAC57EB
MKYVLVMLVAGTLLFTACSKTVDNEEIGDENIDQIEEGLEEDPPTNHESSNGKTEEKFNAGTEQDKVEEKDSSKDQDTKQEDSKKETRQEENGKDEQGKKDQNGLLTEEEAIEKVRSYLDLQYDPDVNIVVDHEDNGRYLVHVFDIVPGNGGVGHTATRGWYYVDRKTGEIESMF